MMSTVLADTGLHIPSWFFLTTSLRILWIDFMERWLYIRFESVCPNCAAKLDLDIVLTLEELNEVKTISCKVCSYGLGELIYRELVTHLLELERLVERSKSEV